MPFKYCDKILEDGHRCGKAFRVQSIQSGQRKCPLHVSKTSHKTNKRMAQSIDLELREFCLELMSIGWKDMCNTITEQQEVLDEIVKNQVSLTETFRGFQLDMEGRPDSNQELWFDTLSNKLLKVHNRTVKLEFKIRDLKSKLIDTGVLWKHGSGQEIPNPYRTKEEE